MPTLKEALECLTLHLQAAIAERLDAIKTSEVIRVLDIYPSEAEAKEAAEAAVRTLRRRCVYCGLIFTPDKNHPEHLCWDNLASANQAAATWKLEFEKLRAVTTPAN